MPLHDSLSQIRAASRSKMPPEAASVIGRAAKQLEQSGIVHMALAKGENAPEFTLDDCRGGTVRSTDLLAKGPLILTFYRGSW